MKINKRSAIRNKLSKIIDEEKAVINSSILKDDWDNVKLYLTKSFATAKALRKVIK